MLPIIYADVRPARFLARESRFIGVADLHAQTVRFHIPNTGRLVDYLIPNARLYLAPATNPARATRFTLVSVKANGRLANVDSSAPNRVFAEWVRAHGFDGERPRFRAEVPYADARLDFLLETDSGLLYVEVKGVTLVRDGVALFPDAPTARGARHLRTLSDIVRAGHRAMAVFVLQADGVSRFAPNDALDPTFGHALREAAAGGVDIRAMQCAVTPQSITAQSLTSIVL